MLSTKAFAVIGVLFLLFVSSTDVAIAQSRVFNAPTTDTVGRERAYLEFEYLRQVPEGASVPRTSVFVPRAVIGLGRNVEIGANASFVRTEGSGRTNAFFSPNIKWKFYDNEENGIAASGGGILFTPINNRVGTDTFGMVYSNVSKKVQASYGPRVTTGVYGIVGSTDRQFSGPRAGAMVGYEQPLHPKVNFVADWLSGKSGFGYFTPGVSIGLPKDSRLKIGYSFGNDSFAKTGNNENNRFLFVKYGISF